MRGFTVIVRALAKEGALGPERFAELMGLEVSEAQQLFAELAAIGMQVDEDGNVVGAALTTRETQHAVRVAGRDLYAWCALDTLFIPGLVGATAEIESRGPSGDERFRLTVSPERVESCEPDGVWLSVFLPGSASAQTGPASPT